jgi:glutamine synthetase
MSNFYKAEYIWIDGSQPTAKLRSKTKIVKKGEAPPIWGFDGSSTNQAPGHNSDCVLKPVFICPDPIRGGDNKLVLNEVLLTDMKPHPSNTRAACSAVAKKYASHDPWFGIEQEYTFFEGSKPLGWPDNGFPAPQGPYYCGVGADEVFGRQIVEAHTDACLTAGLAISGTNGEVMPGQWEFQIGPAGTVEVGDHMWVARWLLYRIAEDFGVNATLDPKPVKGDWNGAGAHTNFSTKEMRSAYEPCVAAAEALAKKHALHIENYGYGIEGRLTGLHETASWRKFSYGVSDRGASVRIPWQVAREKKGYIEDRRPNANMDPYVVTRLITETVCSAFESGAIKGTARSSRNGAKASANGASKRRVPAKAVRAKAGARR